MSQTEYGTLSKDEKKSSRKKVRTRTNNRKDNWKATKLCDVDAGFHGLSGLTADNNGNLYFTNSENVFVLLRNHTKSQVLITVPGSDFESIEWHQNILYMCDLGNHRILTYTLDGNILSTLVGNTTDSHMKAELDSPRFITVHNNGDIYVSTKTNVLNINILQSTMINVAGCGEEGYRDGPTQQARFKYPLCHAVKEDGTIYVVDHGNNCIRQIKNGVVFTVTGLPSNPGSSDGPLNAARFRYPRAVLALDDVLLIGDQIGLRLIDMARKIVTTQTRSVRAIRRLCMASGIIYAGSSGAIYRIDNTWQWERFLWIGHLKVQPPHCLLATLPKDIVKEIAVHVQTL